MPTFIPYRLVHAHLPAPPSLPNSIPELRVPSDQPHPSISQLASLPLHPEHAQSVVRDPTTGILARLIQNGHCLELSNLSLISTSTSREDGSDKVRIYFPHELRPLVSGSIVPSREDERLYVVAVSTTNILYRINFPLGPPSKGDRFIFSLKSNEEDWCEEWVIPEDVLSACGGIGSLAVTNGNTVVLGCDDGGIIRLTRSGHWRSGSWSALHHRASSRYRLPSLFSRSATSDEQVISIAEFGDEGQLAVLYTFSRDRKLRSWKAATGASLKTIDVRVSSSSSQELVIRGSQPSSSSAPSILPFPSIPLIRIVSHPAQSSHISHLIVIFVASPFSTTSPGTFVVYRSWKETNELTYAGERSASSSVCGAELRGFEVIPSFRREGIDSGWRLWSAWDVKGSLVCETSIIDDILQFSTFVETKDSGLLRQWQVVTLPLDGNKFDGTYFDSLLSLESPNPQDPNDNSDISSTFIAYLFYPGRFSTLTLSTVLDEYIAQLSKQYQVDLVFHPNLSSRMAAIVGSHLVMRANDQTGAPEVEVYRKELRSEWLGIWARARDLDRQARWPLAVSRLDQDLVIFSREGLSIPVPDDFIGLLPTLSSRSDVTEQAIRRLYPSLAPPQARKNVVAISSAGEALAALMAAGESEDSSDALEGFTEYLDSILPTGPEIGYDDLFENNLWPSFVEPSITNEDAEEMATLLAETSSVPKALRQSLDLLSDLATPFGGERLETGYSGYGIALITSNIAQIVQSRYIFARNTLFVALKYMADTGVNLGINETEEAEELLEVLTKCVSFYHRYRVLKMLCEQTGEGVKEQSKGNKRKLEGDDLLAEGLGGLRVGGSDLGSTDYDITYSLLHSLIARQLRPVAINPITSLSPICQVSTQLLRDLNIVQRDQGGVEPGSADVKLAYTVLIDGHSLAAGLIADLYPLSAGMAYIKGRASLVVGTVENAVLCFDQASAGCSAGALQVIFPSFSGPTALAEYYRHVCQLFDDQSLHEPVARFGLLAIRALSRNDQSSRDIWTRVFLAQCSLGNFEDAYSTLTSSPFSDLKTEFLGQLISVMCENNQVGRLNSLGFIGFQDKVEDMLKFKARNSDPLRFPNYYKVLYSWHISRGNYRSAGEIMYLQGRRLGESLVTGSKLPPLELSAMQARSYLAAINALSLVDKRNAWVSVPSTVGRPVPGSKRRKMSSYIPEDEFTQNRQSIDLVSLTDIKIEYTLVLSHLRLSTHIKDLQEYGVTISPEEVVGLFTQRGMFDLAQSSAASLSVDMSDLFQNLASRCVELSKFPSEMGDSPMNTFLKSSPTTSSLQGPPHLLALHYLQTCLKRHDSSQTNFKYTATVADTFFELNGDMRAGWKMPDWLVSAEMARDPERWIARGLRWGWISEAVEWSLNLISKTTPPELLAPKKSNTSYLPYNLFDRLIVASQEGDEKEDKKLQSRVEVLRNEIKRRVDGLEKLNQL